LEPVYERRPGKVRRANPRRVETGVPLKQPCLGMKTGGAGAVRNLYLSAVLNQPIECATFSDPGVRSGDQPERAPGSQVLKNLVGDEAEATPLHNRDERTDSIGRRHLLPDLGGEVWLRLGIGEENGVSQRRFGPDRFFNPQSRVIGGEPNLRRECQASVLG